MSVSMCVHLPSVVYWHPRHLCSMWGSIGQSRFICQVWCRSIQGIYSWLPKGNCHSAFGGSISQSRFTYHIVCTGIQSISTWLPGGSICQSVFTYQVLCTGIQGIYALCGGSIGQSRFICQVWFRSIQGIYSWLPKGVSICQSMFICQVLCTGIQGKYHLSKLKSLIVIWGVFWGCWGGYIWYDCTMLTDCLLPKLFRNKRKFPPFLEESKMDAKYIP